MEKLTSRSNEKIKLAVSVRSSSASRKKSGLFFLEGARLCGDAASCGAQIATTFLTEKALEKYDNQASAVMNASEVIYLISDELSSYLSDTVAPQGIFCLCKMLDKDKSCNKIEKDGKYIALENIQNPDNLGAISRTAEALGISGMIVSFGCDVFNPKALRASMGSLLRIGIIETDDLPSLLLDAAQDGMLTASSTTDCSAEPINSVAFDGGSICVIGNEGAGVSAQTSDACAKKVTIPMGGRAESLNASSAAAIIMWEMIKQR